MLRSLLVSGAVLGLLAACAGGNGGASPYATKVFPSGTLIEANISGHKAWFRPDGAQAVVELENVSAYSRARQTQMAITVAQKLSGCTASYRNGTFMDAPTVGGSTVAIPLNLAC